MQIKLTAEEAATLAIILNSVGGTPEKTPRRYADSILNRLIIISESIAPLLTDGDSSIYFKEGSIDNPLFHKLVQDVRDELANC